MGDKINSNVKLFASPDAREVLEKMVGLRNLGNASYNRFRNLMHGIFAELKDWRKIPENPFAFKGRKLPPRKMPEIPTEPGY